MLKSAILEPFSDPRGGKIDPWGAIFRPKVDFRVTWRSDPERPGVA